MARKRKQKIKTRKTGGFIIGIMSGTAIFIIAGLISFGARNSLSHPQVKGTTTIVTDATPIISPSPTLSLTPTPTIHDSLPTRPAGFCLSVPVLLYHHIEPIAEAQKESHAQLTVDTAFFEKQLEYLKNSGYTSISADQLADALINHKTLPAKSIVITLDDGYSDIHTYAYPLAQKYNMVLNLMIPTGLLDNYGYLTWGQLKEMVDSGLVYAYDHTWSHASLASQSKEKIEFEILSAKKDLEEKLGKTVNIFSYPYGSMSKSVEDILKSNGFIAAFSTINGSLQCDSLIFSLRRTHIGNAPLSAFGL